MRTLRQAVQRIAGAGVVTAIALLGLPTVAAHAIPGATPYLKFIIKFVGEQPANNAGVIGIKLDGVSLNLFAVDLDGNPNTLDLVSEQQFPPQLTRVNFSEVNGTESLSNYVTTAPVCFQHYEELDTGWSDDTHSGSIIFNGSLNTDCFITNTRKPANLTLTQTADETLLHRGDTAHYTLTAKNTGSSTATTVALASSRDTTVDGCTIGAVAATNPAPTLAPGASLVCRATFTVPADYATTSLATTATVTSPSDSTLPAPVVTTTAVELPPVVASSPPPPPIPSPMFHAVAPARLFDTRTTDPQGLITVVKKLYGGATELKVKVTEIAGVPSTGAQAVSLNVTAVSPANSGYVTVYPCGTLPGVSSLNFLPAKAVANAVIAPLSAAGEVCFYATADTNLIADINGWIANASGFVSVNPARLADTRVGDPQGAIAVTKKLYGGATELRLKVTDVAAVGTPATGVSAVSLNVTAVGPVGTGFVTVYPCGTLPGVSSLNYTAGAIVPNAVITPVSAAGEICLYSSVNTHLIVDINGFINTVASFTPVTPTRLFDTRPTDPQGAITVVKKLYGGTTELKVKVTGVAGIPASGAGAIVLNVTAVGPDNTGFVTVYPCGILPGVSSVNYTVGATVPNAVIAPVSALGEVCFYSSANTHLFADVSSWFSSI